MLLVRHGRTDSTGRLLSGGSLPGPELNPAGQREAAAAASFLAGLPAEPETGAVLARPVALITSPVLRARQTAEAAARALGLVPVADPGWAEAEHGDWDGLAFAEIARRWPDEHRRWQTSAGFAAPNGESADQVVQRALLARDRLLATHPGECVAVFTHVTPIYAVLAAALDAGPSALWRMRIDPASVSVLRLWSDGGCEVAGINLTTSVR